MIRLRKTPIAAWLVRRRLAGWRFPNCKQSVVARRGGHILRLGPAGQAECRQLSAEGVQAVMTPVAGHRVPADAAKTGRRLWRRALGLLIA
mgnify:CR=1 FL=1